MWGNYLYRGSSFFFQYVVAVLQLHKAKTKAPVLQPHQRDVIRCQNAKLPNWEENRSPSYSDAVVRPRSPPAISHCSLRRNKRWMGGGYLWHHALSKESQILVQPPWGLISYDGWLKILTFTSTISVTMIHEVPLNCHSNFWAPISPPSTELTHETSQTDFIL